ncbi:type I restriction enzyme S subunit [Rhizobium sp. PP-CC-3A-592]|nr:type I restriction enzyme S subunit [Rhizobium sp. PP-CC-3A-592]
MNMITVADASDFIRGITFKPHELIDISDSDAIVCMRTKNIQADLDQRDLIAVPSRLVRQEQKLLRAGDILISSANSWELVGKCSFVPELPYRATAGGFIAIVRPKPRTHPRFLYHWLNSPATQHMIRNMGRQTTNISNLDVNRFKEIKLPAYGFDQQCRIAAILDKADTVRRKREQAVTLADDFLRSLFLEMFGDPLTNPKKLPIQPLGKFGRIVTGNTPPRSDPANFGDAIEWIKSDNVNTNEHFLTRAVEGLSDKGRSLGRIVPKGSILVTCIAGSPSSIGRAAIANRPVAFNQQINAIIPNPDVNAYFLYVQFLIGKQLVLRSSTNSMKGMISKGEFQKIEFLRPDPHDQARFGKTFEKHVAANNRLLDQKVMASDLFAALSQRAFAGDL